MSGVLYIVATPIGNLDDISRRAIATLKAADTIAAEDTRHSKRLLGHLGIRSRLVSCHEHNEQGRSTDLLRRLQAGEDVALISDAGTPLISDPGYRLVQAAREAGIRVSPIPGASSALAALSAAGLPTDSFYFRGFLPHKSSERLNQLQNLREIDSTLLLFESSHRIAATLAQIAEVFPQNPCVIAKEMTKLHERFLHGTAAELRARIEADRDLQKGEFVVLIDNASAREQRRPAGEEVELMRVLLGNVSVKLAVKIAAQLTGKKKNHLYRLALELQGDADSKPGGRECPTTN